MTYGSSFTELRVRSRLAPERLEAVKGKILGPADYDVRLSGPTVVYRSDGKLLARYMPGALAGPLLTDSYDVLHSLRDRVTRNRGMASGGTREKAGVETPGLARRRSSAPEVASALVGGFNADSQKQYCRLTAWTNTNNEEFRSLFPLFEAIDGHFAEQVPDRYRAQAAYIERTHPDWRIGRTVFTTITVNNSYPTGVHTDKGDLDEGFSTLTVLRRGNYSGGVFTFPEYRIAVDMQDGDLLLMDAHEWHGNTFMRCNVCGEGIGTPMFNPSHEGCETVQPDGSYQYPERISIVSYFRTKMTECGSSADEVQRAYAWANERAMRGLPVDESLTDDEMVAAMTVDEMAAESVG